MISRRISVRISAALDRKLQRRASRAGSSQCEIVREALRGYLERPTMRPYNPERELRLLGYVEYGPTPRA